MDNLYFKVRIDRHWHFSFGDMILLPPWMMYLLFSTLVSVTLFTLFGWFSERTILYFQYSVISLCVLQIIVKFLLSIEVEKDVTFVLTSKRWRFF